MSMENTFPRDNLKLYKIIKYKRGIMIYHFQNCAVFEMLNYVNFGATLNSDQ